MSQEVIQRLTALVNDFDARVQAAPSDSWGNAAPCEGWTAADVVGHITTNMNGVTAGLSDTEPVTPDTAQPVATWNSARSALLEAVSSNDLGKNITGPFGPMPAEQVIGRFVTTDLLVHAWDLARAVGGDEQLNAQAVAGAYSGLKPMDAMIRQPGLFGPKIEAAEGDDLQTEFLKFLGRAV